ncbi:MAG: serine/threonine-protein kinase [Myxococcota bacterium]
MSQPVGPSGPAAAVVPPELAEHPRFELIRVLGRGGFGTVHQAWDRETKRLVALKVAERREAWALKRFKAEFRAAAAISHPNLASLFELHHEGSAWFIVMEYVDGVPFDEWLPSCDEPRFDATCHGVATVALRALERPSSERRRETPPTVPAPTVPDGRVADDQPVPDFSCRRFTPAELPMLRRAFRQLVDAVECLHATGHVHRDLKPSNVLVSADGDVKVVDFGLIMRCDRPERDSVELYAGTPSFMAPEVCLGLPPTPASDWYAVGVMLYLALTGVLPFEHENSVGRVARGFRGRPSELVAGVPKDLDDLCMDLLSIKPRHRPSFARLRATFADERQDGDAPGMPAAAMRSTRDWPLAVLAETLAGPRPAVGSAPRVTLIELDAGGSAAATVENALAEAVADEAAVVLRGRCSEREHLRFRALDGVVDDLAGALAGLGPIARAALMPEAELMRGLAATFPVFSGPEPVAGTSATVLEARAFEALATVLSRLGQNRRVVIVVDDLQAADPASVEPLLALIGPGGPPVEWVLSHRRAADGRPSRLVDAARRRGAGSGDERQPAVHLVSAAELDQPVEAAMQELVDLLAAAIEAEGGSHLRHGLRARESDAPPQQRRERVRDLLDRQVLHLASALG